MKEKEFRHYLEVLDAQSSATLIDKNKRYSDGQDMLHNFRKGAEISGLTLGQTAWGYLTKHLVALRDMVEKDDFSDADDFLEKCQDIINYIRFIWVIGNEKNGRGINEPRKDVHKIDGYIMSPSSDLLHDFFEEK